MKPVSFLRNTLRRKASTSPPDSPSLDYEGGEWDFGAKQRVDTSAIAKSISPGSMSKHESQLQSSSARSGLPRKRPVVEDGDRLPGAVPLLLTVKSRPRTTSLSHAATNCRSSVDPVGAQPCMPSSTPDSGLFSPARFRFKIDTKSRENPKLWTHAPLPAPPSPSPRSPGLRLKKSAPALGTLEKRNVHRNTGSPSTTASLQTIQPATFTPSSNVSSPSSLPYLRSPDDGYFASGPRPMSRPPGVRRMPSPVVQKSSRHNLSRQSSMMSMAPSSAPPSSRHLSTSSNSTALSSSSEVSLSLFPEPPRTPGPSPVIDYSSASASSPPSSSQAESTLSSPPTTPLHTPTTADFPTAISTPRLKDFPTSILKKSPSLRCPGRISQTPSTPEPYPFPPMDRSQSATPVRSSCLLERSHTPQSNRSSHSSFIDWFADGHSEALAVTRPPRRASLASARCKGSLPTTLPPPPLKWQHPSNRAPPPSAPPTPPTAQMPHFPSLNSLHSVPPPGPARPNARPSVQYGVAI